MLVIWATMVGCRVRNREDMINKLGKADISSIRRADKDNGRVGSIHTSQTPDQDQDGDGSNDITTSVLVSIEYQTTNPRCIVYMSCHFTFAPSSIFRVRVRIQSYRT